MSQQNQTMPNHERRQKALNRITSFLQKIEYIQISENQFSTQELQQLSILTEYSIHPMYSSKKLHIFYKKLSEHYWTNISNHLLTQQKRNQPIAQDQCLNDTEQQNLSQTQAQNVLPSVELTQNICQNPLIQDIPEKIVTEAIYTEIKVSKNYHEIKKKIQNFDVEKMKSQNICFKIQMLNLWNCVPCKLENFTPKKNTQKISKNVSNLIQQNLKVGSKVSRKDSIPEQLSRTIILGKNQSHQTKQMKHILKIQAKTNFVDQKKKQQSNLNTLDKKAIQLTYLLNIITKQFFQDFSDDILIVLRQNPQTINILCQKVIQKIKQQHNFIQIYVKLIKKLCKQPLKSQDQSKNRFNPLQTKFVQSIQGDFSKLISQKIQPSCGNFNQYKYQKQMTGICTFIGQLIRQNILSKKIFKVCFWEIVSQYVSKVKQNPQNDIVNECLIAGVVTISDSIGSFQLLKLIQKENSKRLNQIQDNQLQRMIEALVNPSDEDSINRQKQCRNLINSISIEDYPTILINIIDVFESKRMKLKFLMESWKNKIQNLRQQKPSVEIQGQNKINANFNSNSNKASDDCFEEIKREIHLYMKQIKLNKQQNVDFNQLERKTLLSSYQSCIQEEIQNNNTSKCSKIFQFLVIQFLNEFSNTINRSVVYERIQYFMKFINSLKVKDVYEQFLDIVTGKEFQNLMIIECDYPFLVEGLCKILNYLQKQTLVTKNYIFQKIQKSFDFEDEDMIQFYEKVKKHLIKLSSSQIMED